MRKRPRQDGWYRKKNFPHFDLPLQFEAAVAKAANPAHVASHAFRPYIGYTDKKRRFRTVDGNKDFSNKERPIKYCSHHDGYIHAYYGKLLSDRYENYIHKNEFEKYPIGYRSGLGSNAKLAHDAFCEIRKRKSCSVVALDITDFFGNIGHYVLLDNIKKVLSVERLSADWFAVYKSMAQFAWVEIHEIVEHLNLDRKHLPRPLCSTKEFRENIRDSGLVHRNNHKWGIPQGSPISAVFSNVYMLDFDLSLAREFGQRDIYYRRYSDDIIVVCESSQVDEVIQFIKDALGELGKQITINESKTEISHFEKQPSGEISCDRPVTYLGFTFDGDRVFLKNGTVSRYFRRMSYATRRTAKDAEESHSSEIFKRKLYRDFTHLGHSNFYSYAKRSGKVLGDDSPKRQLRRHVDILKRKIETFGK